MTQADISELRIENLDHLGIAAGICDRIGLVELLDERLGTSPDELVSSGRVVKAMILNGLGFVSAPMYLFSRFFEGKPTEHLLGEGIKPEHLNDDKLARVLEKLFEGGLTSLFVEIALRAASREGVGTDRLHLDATSLSVHGSYPPQAESESPQQQQQQEPKPIRITHGYSRDHRPDLKQFLVDLMVSGDGGVPLFLRVADGNESDAAVFAELIGDYRAQSDFEALFVADAALYNEENLKRLGTRMSYVSRVPQTIERAKQLLEALDDDEELTFFDARREGYRLAEVEARYAGFEQRWVVVESEGRARRGIEQLEKRLARERTKATKALGELQRRPFNCERDASEVAKKLGKGLRYHRLEDVTIESEPYHEKPGRPRKDAVPAGYRYRVVAELVRDEAEVARRKRRAGRFVLATNVMDAGALGAEEILETYLDQQVVERGFRFLKDPMFFTSSVFLKTPKRIAALAMVMGLCLLVYSLGERELRLELARRASSIPDQKGKPTRRPTLRWVFQSLQAVHLVIAGASKLIHGLTEEREHVLSFFSAECRRYYLLM